MSKGLDDIAVHPETTNPLKEEKGKYVYSTSQMLEASFIFGPLTACWLIASNFKVFGEKSKALRALLAGVVIVVLLPALFYYLPKSPFLYLLGLVVSFSVYQYGKRQQKQKIKEAIANGIPKASSWKVLLIGVPLLLITLFFFLVMKDVLIYCACSLN